MSINFNNAARKLGASSVASSTREATMQKIGWIREGAGGRFGDIELEIAAYFIAISEDPADALATMARRFGVTPDALSEHPHALVGSVSEICAKLEQRRDELRQLHQCRAALDGGVRRSWPSWQASNASAGRPGTIRVPPPTLARRSSAHAGPGMSISQPVRCASTDSSAHSVIRGSREAARCAVRICRSVHGADAHHGPQEALRTAMIVSGGAASAEVPVSRAMPSGMRASTT